MRYTFRIPIGDWSGDGHGQVEWVHATAAKPIEAVREAYFSAKARLPAACCPESFCDEYQERQMSKETRAALKAAGARVPRQMGVDAMASLVAWFLNQGDPDLDVRLDVEAQPMLPFYGEDAQRRHIGFIGYGLFG